MACTPIKLAFNSFEPEGGAEEKPPVIFLHGVTACKEYWEDIPQTVANATKRKTYAIDGRNHGDTEWTDVFTFDCNVDDLLHFMDTIKAPKAILVGHSMGGMTAIKTALRCPERLEQLVVEDIGVKRPSKTLLNMVVLCVSLALKAVESMPTGLGEELSRKFVFDFMTENLPPEIKHLVKREQADRLFILFKATEDGRYTYKANIPVILEAMKKTETIMTEPTGVYEGPTCFICGKLSEFPVLPDAEQIKEHFPEAEFFSVEDATHNVHFDCPQEFTKILLKFLLKE